MKWLAVCVIAVVGLVEALVKLVISFVLCITILPMIILAEEPGLRELVMKPVLWGWIERIVALEEAERAELRRLRRHNEALQAKNDELVDTVVDLSK